MVNDNPKKAVKEDLAKERTDLASERTIMASERTFSAWVRTGISAEAAGLGLAKFLNLKSALPLGEVIGLIFILMGGLVYLTALWRYHHIAHHLREAHPQDEITIAPTWIMSIIIITLFVSAILAFVLIFLMMNQ
jgi:putative membrane protein